MTATTSTPDHLFISYASPDVALAEWLAERLTLAGYPVWFDRWKLLGGEDWSREITRVLNNATFRVLHLVTPASVDDSYAASERAQAANLSHREHRDFLIPLLAKPTEPLPFELSNRNLIDFRDWGRGLAQLIALLEREGAPRQMEPRPLPAPAPEPPLLREGDEPLFSNALAVEGVPPVLHEFKLSREPSPAHHGMMNAVWAYWNPRRTRTAFAFDEPETLPQGIATSLERSISWRDVNTVEGFRLDTIVPALLRKGLAQHCLAMGLQPCQSDGGKASRRGWFHFPAGLLPKDKQKVLNWAGKRAPITVLHQKKRRGETYRAHLAFEPVLERIGSGYLVFLNLGLYPVDGQGRPFTGRTVNARAKAITKTWTNAHLLVRSRLVFDFLADGNETIVLRTGIRLTPCEGRLDVRLDEEALARIGADAVGGEQMEELEE